MLDDKSEPRRSILDHVARRFMQVVRIVSVAKMKKVNSLLITMELN